MTAFYDNRLTENFHQEAIALDTNVLSSLFLDKMYWEDFMNIFSANQLLIDPIVKLEFLRGAFRVNAYEEQSKFLTSHRFTSMADNHDIQTKIYEHVFNVARIYSHQGNPSIPLGDIFIIARLAVYDQSVLFLTRDYGDFDTMLFDRKAIVSIERKLRNKLGPPEIVEHIQILQFNHEKYQVCLDTLPK